MPIYHQLIDPYRAIVDRLVSDTKAEGWDVRRAYLTSIYHALDRNDGEEGRAEATLAAIIAGVVERLGDPDIEERLQAGIYAASANPDHRIASADWFDRNPDEYAAIQKEIAGGRRLN